MHGARLFSVMGCKCTLSMGRAAILPGAHSRVVLVRLDHVIRRPGLLLVIRNKHASGHYNFFF